MDFAKATTEKSHIDNTGAGTKPPQRGIESPRSFSSTSKLSPAYSHTLSPGFKSRSPSIVKLAAHTQSSVDIEASPSYQNSEETNEIQQPNFSSSKEILTSPKSQQLRFGRLTDSKSNPVRFGNSRTFSPRMMTPRRQPGMSPSRRFKPRYSTSAIPRSHTSSLRSIIDDLPDTMVKNIFSSLTPLKQFEQGGEAKVDANSKLEKEIQQLRERVSSKDLKIKELEEKLAMQRFDFLNESQSMKLEIEQLILDDKIRTAELEAMDERTGTMEVDLVNAQDEKKALEKKQIELEKTIQKLELSKKRSEDRLRILDRKKNNDVSFSQSFVDTLQLEMDALNSKVKAQMKRMHNQEETLSQQRSELNKKTWSIEKLTTENSKMKSTMTNLEKRAKILETQDKEVRRLKETNHRLQTELKEVQGENLDLQNRLQTQAQLMKDMEARVNEMENSHKSIESKNTRIAHNTKDQEMKLERLENQIANLRQNLEIAEKKSEDFRSQLHAAQKASLQDQLERDECIMVLKREHSAKLLAAENDQNAVLKLKRKKLQEVESEKAVIEAKYSALCTQLSILENSNKKTLDIQNSTIRSLEETLKQTQDKLAEAKYNLRQQSEIAETSRIEHRQFQEKLKVQNNELNVQKSELENKATLENTIDELEKKLKDFQSKNTRLELEKGQLQMRLQSSDEQLNLISEQRTRSFKIQQQTIEQLEKQIEEMRKVYRASEDKFTESDKRWSKQAELHKKAESAENTELKVSRDSRSYKELYETEKLGKAELVAQMKDLKKRNKDGGKAYKKLLKRNEELEVKWKRINRVRDSMNRALQKILHSLERELDQFKAQLQFKEKGSDEWKITSLNVKKLEKLCEGWKNTQRDLNMEESEGQSKKLKRSRTAPRIQKPHQQRKLGRRESLSNELKYSPVPGQRRLSTSLSEEKEPEKRIDPEWSVNKLKQKLNVDKEVLSLQRALEKIKQTPQNSRPNDVIDQIKRLQDDLDGVSSRIGAAREEVAVTLKKYHKVKSEVALQIEMLKQSSTGLKLNLDSRLDNAISDLRSRLEEKSSKLSQKKRSKLQAEFDNLKKKKKQLEQKSQELKTLESRLSRISNAIKELTNASEHSLKTRLLISSLISDAKTMVQYRSPSPKLHLMAKHRNSITKLGEPKPSCPYCKTKNTVEFNDCKDPAFSVSCWNCKKVFFVEHNPSRAAFVSKIPDAPVSDMSSCIYGQKEGPLPQIAKVSSTMYDKILIKGLSSSISNNTQLLKSFYNIIFSDCEIVSQTFVRNDVEVSLDSPVTTEQISDMLKMVELLHKGKHKVSLFVEQLGHVTILGVSENNNDSNAVCLGLV